MVGTLLVVLTTAVFYQWYFNPNTHWQRAEARRKALEKALTKKTKDKDRQAAVRQIIAGYEAFVRRFPRHPKAAAGWVTITGLEERLDFYGSGVVRARANLAALRSNWQVRAELRKLTKHPESGDIAAEALASMSPRKFRPGQRFDTLTELTPKEDSTVAEYASTSTSKHTWGVAALGAVSGTRVELPICVSQRLIGGTQVWRHDLGRVAFATAPRVEDRAEGPLTYGARWMVWVADLRAGRLYAFLPTWPLPDLARTEGALLVWSSDGKRLTCRGETFVVD